MDFAAANCVYRMTFSFRILGRQATCCCDAVSSRFSLCDFCSFRTWGTLRTGTEPIGCNARSAESIADSALVVELRESDASCTFALKGFADVDALKQLDASELEELLSVHVQSKEARCLHHC